MYVCVAHGEVHAGTIESWLVADRGDGLRGSTTRKEQGKRAVTHVKPLESLASGAITYVSCRLETGRTHQIRVHLASVGHPLIGDETYAGRARGRHADPDLKALVSGLGGVALHAAGLAFVHPATGEPCEFSSPLPNRIEGVLCHLRNQPG